MSDENDQSTNGVIDWIHYHEQDFIRINPSDIISEISIDSNFSASFKVNNVDTIELSKVKSFWYRRGHLNLLTKQMTGGNFPFTVEINNHLKNENLVLGHFILKNLANKNSLGDFFKTDVNKFEVLLKAEAKGLLVPDTIVTSKKTILEQFIKKHRSVVTKSNSEVIMRSIDDITLVSYTKRIGDCEFDSLDEVFSPSLFQEEIIKKYELRIFFIDEEYYAMAIFSQLDSQTSVDFRVYNKAKPNRMVPYLLPKETEIKLNNLMKEFGYNTGSIDMIVTPENKLFFLEVNPVGQFEMVSNPCNYYLQKKIADRLCFNNG